MRQLQRDLKAVRADDKEVQELVEAHEREKADNARMRAELEDAQVCTGPALGCGGSCHGKRRAGVIVHQREPGWSRTRMLTTSYDVSLSAYLPNTLSPR